MYWLPIFFLFLYMTMEDYIGPCNTATPYMTVEDDKDSTRPYSPIQNKEPLKIQQTQSHT